MFGVMAIGNLIFAGLSMFSDFGLKLNIVQSTRGSDPAFLNTAWVVQIARGVVLWVMALCLAMFLFLAGRVGALSSGTAYADPRLPYVIAIMSLSVLINGFQSTKLFEASRNLSIRHITGLGIVAQITGLICMVAWGLIDRSIWALVAGNICSTLVTTLLSHFLLMGNNNRWQLDRSALHEMFHFGKWIFLSSILGFLAGNGDRLLLGGLVNANVLGVYIIAFSMFNIVDQVLSRIMSDVSFPALSEVARDRLLLLRATHYKFYVAFASFAYFCAGALIISGQWLIDKLYDHRYEDAGWILQVLAIALVSIPFRSVTQCFMALGKPKLDMHGIAVHVIALFLLAPVAFYYWGTPGSIWAISLSNFAYLPLVAYYSIKHELLDVQLELKLLPVIAIGMGVAKLILALAP